MKASSLNHVLTAIGHSCFMGIPVQLLFGDGELSLKLIYALGFLGVMAWLAKIAVILEVAFERNPKFWSMNNPKFWDPTDPDWDPTDAD